MESHQTMPFLDVYSCSFTTLHKIGIMYWSPSFKATQSSWLGVGNFNLTCIGLEVFLQLQQSDVLFVSKILHNIVSSSVPEQHAESTGSSGSAETQWRKNFLEAMYFREKLLMENKVPVLSECMHSQIICVHLHVVLIIFTEHEIKLKPLLVH